MSPTSSVRRQKRPNCATCAHSLSFHGTSLESCRALGCNCAAYVGTTQLGFDTVDLQEAADILHLSGPTEVAGLGVDGLELEWVPESMLDTRLGSAMTYRVKRSVLEEFYNA